MSSSIRKIILTAEIRDQVVSEEGIVQTDKILYAGGVVHIGETDLPADATLHDMAMRLTREARLELGKEAR